jgi:gluconolactonase
MIARSMFCLIAAVSAAVAASASAAAAVNSAPAANAVPGGASHETTVVDNVLGPEGPLYVDGNLYFVGWVSNTLSRWDGKKVTVLNDAKGCGHNGLALTKHKTFLLACTNDPGAIIEADLNGKQMRRWDTDAAGGKLAGGINDIVVAANGSAYATIFGVFGEQPGEIVGRILYLAPGGQKWVEVAKDLNYANGIGVSPDQKTLYVSETVGNCILKFTINTDGTLSHRANFALLNVLTKNKNDSPWLGPDSMKIDPKGNIYVAQWSGGKVLKISPDGKLLHVFPIAAGDGTTNVAFGKDGKELYVTVVKNPNDDKAVGKIVRIPNVD